MTSPLNEFTVREQPAGGDVGRVVQRKGSLTAYKSLRMVILVHGFDVSQQTAAENFETFRDKLLEQLSGSEQPPVWAFHWPSDPPGSPVAYSVAIPVAQLAGEQLGELLLRLNPAQQVILIGHSLGCRVVLEALRYVADKKVGGAVSAGVPLACLLAAAVPVGYCEGPGKRYSPSVIENAVHVLFSRNDRDLRVWFRIGQAFYEKGKGEAVGLHGLPGDRWTDPSYETRLKHKDYWRAAESVKDVARIIDPVLPRVIATRPLLSGEPPESRKLETREIGSRAPGDYLDSEWTNCWPIAGA
jgi:pimeloyl-ACP methyl ester carboxylesterase